MLTPEQARQLFDALRDDRLLPLYLVTIHTGLRQGELLALRWSDVDLEADTLTVTGTLDRKIRQRTDPKTGKSRRIVPLTPQAMEALQVHQVRQNLEGTQGSDDLVFRVRGARPTTRTRQFGWRFSARGVLQRRNLIEPQSDSVLCARMHEQRTPLVTLRT